MKLARKKILKITSLSILPFSVLFYIVFAIWYFGNFKITKWGNIDITNHNIVESFYWLKRDLFWSKSLNFIDNKFNQPALKTLALESYTYIIPVNQWWSPLRNYKIEALNSLIDLHHYSQNWKSLQKTASELIKINPTNVNGWYHLGQSLIHQNQQEEAISAFRQSLNINITHLPTIKSLSQILWNQKKYHQIYKILTPYLTKIPINNELCFFWGEEKFTKDQKYCTNTTIENKFFIPINTNNLNSKMIRIDPPQGNFSITKIEFLSIHPAKIFTINNFSQWELSKDIKKTDKSNFYSVGGDPFISTTLPSSTNLAQFNHLVIHAKSSPKEDREIKNLLSRLKEKIPFLDEDEY